MLALVHQARARWILEDVLHFRFPAFVGTEDVVERLVLPDRPLVVQCLIDFPRRAAFHEFQDVSERVWPPFCISQRGKHNMDVGWHDYASVEGDGSTMFCTAVT